MNIIQGSKSGQKKQRQPYVQPDSARSMDVIKLLYAFAEGEIVGPVDGERSVLLEGTPLLGDNNLNFTNVTWDFRSGTVDQTYITGFPEVNNEVTIGVELTSASPWTRYFNNTQLSALRVRLSWNALQQNQLITGDVTGYKIDYSIDLSTDNGPFITVLQTSVNDKTTTKYSRAHRIDLPEAKTGWTVRVRRLTPNAYSSLISDTMNVESVAEVVDAKLRYPMTAIGGISFDASTFQSIPKLSVVMKGRIVKIPSNYNPESRTYTGVWDGTFKRAWTDNPAWFFYDLVLDPMVGLGDRVNESMINKWKLYQIAQYCDELVPDGKGGKEPRFTCNVYLQSREQAYTVLQDWASLFHGMSYWDGDKITVSADMPSDPVYSFSSANIIDGSITYSGTRWEDRHTMAIVSWDNPANNYETEQEPVWDESAQDEYGFEQLEIAAWGCTSQGQAQRQGKWALISEQLETRQVTFRTGSEGYIPAPGDVIKLSDNLLSGVDNGGRIAAVNGRSITLDRVATVKAGDHLTVNLSTGKSDTRLVQSVKTAKETIAEQTRERSIVTVQTSFDSPPEINAIWVVDSDEVNTMLFRVISITSPEAGQFEINAIQQAPSKFDYIDQGTRIEAPPEIITPTGVQEPPPKVIITEFTTVDQGISSTTVSIGWEAAKNAIAYDIEWRRDSLPWVTVPRQGSQSFDIEGAYSGNYIARVRAVNSLGVSSLPTSSMMTAIKGKTTPPPVPSVLRAKSIAFGIELSWGFPPNAETTAYTEIEYSTTLGSQQAKKLGDFAYPQNTHTLSGLAAGILFFFRARLVDRSGNIGEWTAWVEGSSSSASDDVFSYLEGKITETQLSKDLLEKLDQDGLVEKKLENSLMLKAQKTIDGKPYIAGMGFGVGQDETGKPVSQFLIAASTFAVIDPNIGTPSAPFIIDNGQVFIQSAMIKDGTINMAKISGALQSDNFITEKQGWQLDKNGNLEFNGTVEGGGRLTINNQQLRVYDANGTLRVRLGVWS